MNAKQLTAALALVAAGTAAMAAEATQFVDPVSTLSRAGIAAVQAAKQQVPSAIVVSNHEATQFADAPQVARDRAEVRAEARAVGRAHTFNALYVGS